MVDRQTGELNGVSTKGQTHNVAVRSERILRAHRAVGIEQFFLRRGLAMGGTRREAEQHPVAQGSHRHSRRGRAVACEKSLYLRLDLVRVQMRQRSVRQHAAGLAVRWHDAQRLTSSRLCRAGRAFLNEHASGPCQIEPGGTRQIARSSQDTIRTSHHECSFHEAETIVAGNSDQGFRGVPT